MDTTDKNVITDFSVSIKKIAGSQIGSVSFERGFSVSDAILVANYWCGQSARAYSVVVVFQEGVFGIKLDVSEVNLGACRPLWPGVWGILSFVVLSQVYYSFLVRVTVPEQLSVTARDVSISGRINRSWSNAEFLKNRNLGKDVSHGLLHCIFRHASIFSLRDKLR